MHDGHDAKVFGCMGWATANTVCMAGTVQGGRKWLQALCEANASDCRVCQLDYSRCGQGGKMAERVTVVGTSAYPVSEV
eukprot:363724-Chlamydomonas_euryale.AAC.7